MGIQVQVNKNGSVLNVVAHALLKNDIEVWEFKQFLCWLFSKEFQQDMAGCGRALRRCNEKFCEYIPIQSYVDEIHKVVYVDDIEDAGIRMLIAVSNGCVLDGILYVLKMFLIGRFFLKYSSFRMAACDGAGATKRI